VIKREAYRYNIEALGEPWSRASRSTPSTGSSTAAFRSTASSCSSSTSGSAIHGRARDRSPQRSDARVARSLAALFHPILYPGVGTLLRITQQELGYLVGLSRQRVNEALRALQSSGLIRVEYGVAGARPRRLRARGGARIVPRIKPAARVPASFHAQCAASGRTAAGGRRDQCSSRT
jgi:hypothetical protein